MIDDRKRSRVVKKKINDKEEKKFQKLYTTFITNTKRYRIWQYTRKYSFEKFKENIFQLLDSEQITYAKAKNILNISIKYYNSYLNRIINNNVVDDIDIEDNNDIENNIENPFIDIQNLLLNPQMQYKLEGDKSSEIIIDFYIEIFDNIYIKFNKFCEDFITHILILNLNKNKFFNHILKMNIKIINNKYKYKLRYLKYDYYDIIDNITYDDIIESQYINTNINLIKNILERIFEKPDYNLFICKFIDYKIQMMLKDFGRIYEGDYFESFNKYIIENYKLNTEYKIKIILLNFINYINLNYDKSFDNFENFNNLNDMSDIDILKSFTDYTIEFVKIKNLVKELIKNKEIDLDMLYEADLDLMRYFYKNRLQCKCNKLNCIADIYYIYEHKPLMYLWYKKIENDIYINKCMNVFRNQFINLFLDKIKPVKDINKIIENRLFDFRDTFLTLDEKVELFKKTYSGKVKSNELEKFIINSNELSSFLIKNVSIKEEHVKYTLFTSNYKLLEIIADMKFHFKSEHFRYIISENNLVNLVKIINKYRPFDFSENIEWYKFIEHLLTDIDIVKILYEDDNEDLQIKLKDKIQKYQDSKFDMSVLSNMEFNNFCKYIIENNIKLEINDILKINDNNKRLFLFRLHFN